MGAVRPHLERREREAEVVDRARRGGEVEHRVDGLLDRDELDAVVVPEVERVAAQALDVLEAPGVEVVEADDVPVAGEQVLAQVRPKEAGSAGRRLQCSRR